ncbi:MAG: archease [Anaerolineae bacterium]|nr:archease [Anaerolineae bacterium]
MGYKEVRHTADVAIRAWGDSLEELFTSAARGMFSLIGEADSDRSVHIIKLSADDLETLLVDWLTELIYLSDAHQEAYHQFDVRLTPSWELEAVIRGGPIGRRTGAVKAATYHGLRIEAKQGAYSATIVFDT